MKAIRFVAVGVLLIACSWWMLAAAAGQIAAGGLQFLAGLWLIAAPLLLNLGLPVAVTRKTVPSSTR